ncbi:RhoGAP-domain-containing protein [Obba rivulosa]|uniref:RhoGAP-domain-containing protein n=1 Tax=Obba rivulosa TaxID=1052685 RepID=A0A8E2AX68_9APHY|nr:RhoGAP-domain-containing protein [Obba rivulosa]
MSDWSETLSPSRHASLESPQDAMALFDLHLKFVSESYLTFFQERKRIEEAYVDALARLHHRVKDIDLSLDERSDLSTTRAAWSEVRDNVEREADTRAAFLGTLTSDIINPLVALRETQDRIRKRIREDLKDAISAHTEYAENTLPRLKRNYLKKCQEVEDYKAAAAAAGPLSPTSTPEQFNFNVTPRTSQSGPTRPTVTSPQPLRPLDRRPSQHAGPRNRSPSTSTALQDLAHQGKKQLNQLKTFLDKGGNIKDGGRSDNALRTVKAKREAGEADREYRKGVHFLETLRLRRVKIMESGYNSLESFIRESAECMKNILERYLDNMKATVTTESQLCSHGRRMIDKISSEKDARDIASHIPRLMASSVPKPVYYWNFTVGECRDLIFGVSLVDYATARGLADGEVPKIVRLCIKEIEARGLDAEGIYRVSGRHAAVQELQHKIERNEAAFAFNPAIDDVYAVSSLLKQYLRELPEPVFKFPLQDRIQHSEDLEEHASNNFLLLRSKLRRLPPIHQATFKAIIEHLSRIASRAEKNKMDAKNLAIVFGSFIFGEDELPKAGGDLLQVQSWKDSLMEDVITHANVVFQSSDSPPLPAAPLDEQAAPIALGTTHTKLSAMPPPPAPPSPRRSPRVVGISLSPSSPSPRSADRPLAEDFTPQLPPRPADSIHPSLRAGPMSAAPNRRSLQLPLRPPQWFDDTSMATASSSTAASALSGRSQESGATAGVLGRSQESGTAMGVPGRDGKISPSPPLPAPWPEGDASASVSTLSLAILGSRDHSRSPSRDHSRDGSPARTQDSHTSPLRDIRALAGAGSASAPTSAPASVTTFENALSSSAAAFAAAAAATAAAAAAARSQSDDAQGRGAELLRTRTLGHSRRVSSE